MTPIKSGHSERPVLIVGGGPVGLLLALFLNELGIECKVLEQKTEIDPHSKSIGIHPVSLELLDELDLTGPFLKAGVKIRRGIAYSGRGKIGTISFASCPPPHSYILSLPQAQTEQILETRLGEVSPDCLVRGTVVSKVETNRDRPSVTAEQKSVSYHITADYLIGCDGTNSLVRRSAGIPFTGKPYPDTYIMGDFSDETGFGRDAVVYLHPDGLVESFPLPGGMRRWVVKTDSYIQSFKREQIEELVRQRTGYPLNGTENRMLSSFGVQHYLAEPLCRDRIILAGDAAHVVSPIGGQGMNLGWLGAWDLAHALKKVLSRSGPPDHQLRKWSVRTKIRARKAARRAELNMWLGRKHRSPLLRKAIAWGMTHPPLEKKAARIFTMRDLV
ncbi:MAG: NAD(P)/FAD-dependent oxidoreductase [Balneolaceae bacterium]